MKEKLHLILTIFFSLLIFGVVGYSIFSSINDTTTILQSYCEYSGGEWYFYECQEIINHPCSELKTGYWCDYPDGTSKSENELEYELNSTTSFH